MRSLPFVRPFLLVLAALHLVSAAATAQRRVSGRVTATGTDEPLAGARVTVVGTSYGATTDDQGAFSVAAPSGGAALLVRRLGYKRRTVAVAADATELRIALDRDVLELETQVITGTATSVARQNAANDVAVVTADQLSRVPAPSVENALAGKIAGAQIIANSGAPGGGNQIRLRGVTSVFGSADPLYVVDGVIVSNETIQSGTNALTSASRNTSNATNQDNGVNRIADFNPNDIESIEILKGASASAIYGSKASNGVVLIKTKSGTSGRTRLDLTQRIGTSQLSRKLSQTYGGRRVDLATAYGQGTSAGLDSATIRDSYARCGGFCDFEQQLFGRTPLSYETNLSVRGGTQATTFYVSGLNKYDGGIQNNTGYTKQAIRLNLNQLIGSRLTLQANTNLIRTLTERGISNNDNTNITPYFVFAETPYWYDLRPRNGLYPRNPFVDPQFGTNPFQNADFLRTPEEVFRLVGSVAASYNLLADEHQTLQLRLDGGADGFNQQTNIFSPAFLYFEGKNFGPGTATSLSGNVLNANLNAAVVHTFFPGAGLMTATTSLGLQRETSRRRSTNIVTHDLVPLQQNVNRGSQTQVFADRQEVRGLAFFGQEELLALEERLLLTAGVRAERSTVNGDVNKYYAFPKASASFRLANPTGWVDELKPRIAIGQSGNLPLYQQKYSPALATVYEGLNGLQYGPAVGSPTIRPERQTEVEGGFDAQFLRSRASLSLTLYRKTIDDVILQVVPAPSTGRTVLIENGGRFRNTGTEALVALTPAQWAGGEWVSRTTFARNTSVVLALPPGVQFFDVARDASGQRVSFGSGYGQGRLQVGQPVTLVVGECGPLPNGGTCVGKVGDAAPKYTMGFANEVTWGGWRLYALLDRQVGGTLVNVTKDVFDALANSNDRPDGGVARADSNDSKGFVKYVEDGGFTKLREVSVSYQLPKEVTARLLPSGESVRFEFAGRNLKTWTRFSGVDPEVSNFGSQQISRFIDLAPFPPSRTYFFSIAVGF